MAEYWPYTLEGQEHSAQAAQAAQAQAEKYARYSDLMSASQPFVVDEILASYRFDDHQCVLDVGGGQGTFLSRLGLHATHLQLKLFDLPEVAALAQANFARQGLDARARAHPGSFLKDPLPQGADLVTLIRVAHDHPDADVHTLLAAIYEALPPGGTLLLSEPMAQEPGETPQGDAYFHFYLLAMGAGRLRTPRELMAMMAQAGFAHLEIVPNPMPLQTQIVIGRKCKGLPLVSGNNVNNN
jgi:demethylspheroidene O-methyltransferase